jgi:hypothetical protein
MTAFFHIFSNSFIHRAIIYIIQSEILKVLLNKHRINKIIYSFQFNCISYWHFNSISSYSWSLLLGALVKVIKLN